MFLTNLAKLGSLRSCISFMSVTDQLYSLSRKSLHGAPKAAFTSKFNFFHKYSVWILRNKYLRLNLIIRHEESAV